MDFILMNVSSTGTYMFAALRGCIIGAIIGLIVAVIMMQVGKSRRGKWIAQYQEQGFQVLCEEKALGVVLMTGPGGRWLILRPGGHATPVFERAQFRGCKVVRPSGSRLNILVETDHAKEREILMKFSTPPLNKKMTANVTQGVEAFVGALQGHMQEA